MGAAFAVGQFVMYVAGWRLLSPLAPAVGLAVLAPAAWVLVRLPGEGSTALASLSLTTVACAAHAIRELDWRDRLAAPSALLVVGMLGACSLPFIVEGRFGILGTGFNVDMSQHLFAADWLANPLARTPDLIAQGYPMGPHALAATLGVLTGGNLALAFSGLTIAIPVIAGLAAYEMFGDGPRWRAALAAALAGLPYLAASFLAQGSFKELMIATLVLAFAVALFRLAEPRPGSAHGRVAVIVPALIAAGAVYVYSAPGLAWPLTIVGLWGGYEFLRARREHGVKLRAWLGARLAPLVLGVAVVAIVAAPESGRMLEFRGNVSSVAGGELVERADPVLLASAAPGPAVLPGLPTAKLSFDDELGNLFGDISPFEAGGIWPSGDFRVQPGDGSTPAVIFWLGVLLALAAAGAGVRIALARGGPGERVLLAALAAAIAIAAAGYVLSTPYTAAKLLLVCSPLVVMFAAGALTGGGSPRATMLAIAFVTAAGGSSLLALANAPVGPEDYSAGLAKLRPKVEKRSTLVLARPGLLAEKYGRDWIGWELRGAKPLCVEPDDGPVAGARRAPRGVRWVVTTAGASKPPYARFRVFDKRGKYTLWQGPKLHSERPGFDPGNPTACDL